MCLGVGTVGIADGAPGRKLCPGRVVRQGGCTGRAMHPLRVGAEPCRHSSYDLVAPLPSEYQGAEYSVVGFCQVKKEKSTTVVSLLLYSLKRSAHV